MIAKGILVTALLVGLVGVSIPSIAQTYDPIFNPQDEFFAESYCVDQYGARIGSCPIYIFVDNYIYSNAHYHTSYTQAPVSYYTCLYWSGNNCGWVWDPYVARWAITAISSSQSPYNVVLRIRPSLVGQAEALVAQNALYADVVDFAVGYDDLYYSNHPVEWCRIGGSETGASNPQHGNTYYNRYMTSAASYGLWYATLDYFAAHPGVTQICVNDKALPFGGKFDLYANWTSPHSSHDRGTAADVATNSNQCNPTNCTYGGTPPSPVIGADFLQNCIQNGANAAGSILHSDHVHCQFASTSSFPN